MAKDLVLLTGATGMIGFKTLVLLLEAGYMVRAAVRNQGGFDKIAALPQVVEYKTHLSSFIVPDITVPGAYDEAVKGVKYVVHIASPLAGNVKVTDFQSSLIQPAIQGTVGILESAAKTTSITRVVITGSVASIASFEGHSPDHVIDEQFRNTKTKGPFNNEFSAYAASKALAYEASRTFMNKHHLSFDVIYIMPTLVLGRDNSVTDASNIAKGTNAFLMGLLLGHPSHGPMYGTGVHLDDVAKLHVLSLDPNIEGNQDFLAAGPYNSVVEWTDAFDIIKKHYPKQYKAGLFKFDSIPRPVTTPTQISSAKAQKTFNITFKGFEEQVVSVVDHYLELLDQQ